MATELETEASQRRASLSSERAFLGTSTLLFLACAAGTIYTSLTTMQGGMSMTGKTWFDSVSSFMRIWMVMMGAMMLPSLVPELLSYRRLVGGAGVTNLWRLTALAGAGYFLVWAGFGAVAYILGLLWSAAGMVWMDFGRFAPAAAGIIVLLAGIFQFTTWKAREIGCCRDTHTLAESLNPNANGAWRYGLRLGLHCYLCCWGFMAILLVTGMMNLASMAVIAAVITMERVTPRPMIIVRAAGILILIAGIILIVRVPGGNM
jgi:predicted metal-binding membrane protein